MKELGSIVFDMSVNEKTTFEIGFGTNLMETGMENNDLPMCTILSDLICDI